MSLRSLAATDVGAVSAWLARLPLLARYGLSEARASAALGGALTAGDLLLAAEDAAGVGALAWCLPEGMFGRSPYLKLLAVRCPGQGVGERLMAGLEQRLTGDLFLLVSDFNLPAQRFYERLGYLRVGTLEAYVLPDVNEHLYRKRLAATAQSGMNDVTQAQVSSPGSRFGQDDVNEDGFKTR